MSVFESDQMLIASCLAGERRGWNTFVQQFTRYVYFLIGTTGKRYSTKLAEADAADLHAEIFLSFIENDFKRLREFEGRNQCTLKSWVRMIAIRKTIDFLRKKRLKQVSMDSLSDSVGFDPQGHEPDALSALINEETLKNTPDLSTVLNELREKDQVLIKMFLVDQLSAQEVATALQLSVGAVYTRKNRVIERLRDIVEKSRINV